MQLSLVRQVFPAWSSAATLVREHATSAARFAAAAVRATNGADRLDAAVRAMTSFDHAIDNANHLPTRWLVPDARKMYRGYDAAKHAVSLLVGSGLIPGARERVGRQQMKASRSSFDAAVDVARSDRSRYGRHLAPGWLDATAEDALTGAMMLRRNSKVAVQLLDGINRLRAGLARRGAPDDALIQRLKSLFDEAGAELDRRVALADPAPKRGAGQADAATMGHTTQLLTLVEHQARALADAVVEPTPA